MITYLMKFDEGELEAIYSCIERDETEVGALSGLDREADALQRVVNKVCANKIGPDAHPSGAIGVLYET